MTDAPPPIPSAPPVPPKARGCFFYGCIISLVLLLIVGIAGFFGVRYMANRFNEVIVEYTDTTAATLPKVDMPADELQKLDDRIDAFAAAVKAHTNTPPLVLTGRDLNALLINSPNTKGLKDHVYVALEGDQIKGEISLPLGEIVKVPLLHTEGRYLNGQGSIKAVFTNDNLFVTIESLQVKGKPLPDRFLAVLQQQNFAAGFNTSSNSTALKQYESIVITNGTVIIKAKAD